MGDKMKELKKEYRNIVELIKELYGIGKHNKYTHNVNEDIKCMIILILNKKFVLYHNEFRKEFLIKKEEENYYYNKAKERLILDRDFRERYFIIREKVEKYL